MGKIRKFLAVLFVFSASYGYSQELSDSICMQEDIISFQSEIPDTIEHVLNFEEYDYWEIATLQGKLKMEGLPLSPSIKIFMQKDSLISISIRAPFIGEASRLEVTQNSVTAINKMNKTYVNEDISNLKKYYPGGLTDLQNLLLARVFIPGYDLNETAVEELVDIYYEDDQFNIIPKPEFEIDGIKYGFVVDSYLKPLLLIVLPTTKPEMELSALYNYTLQGYDIFLSYQDGERHIEASLELKDPEWKGEAPKSINLDKKYRELSIEEFIRSFNK